MSRGTTDIHCLEVDDQRIVHLCWLKGVSIGRIASTVAFNDCDVRHGLFFRPSFWKICAKAGFPGALGLLILVPILNFVFLLWLAFAKWPSLSRNT